MGRNSKAKRDAKVKAERRRQQQRAAVDAGPWATDDLGFGHAPAGMGRMFRTSCTECGSEDLSWMPAPELVDRVGPDQNARVEEGLAFLGRDGEAWLCGACGGFGIMS